MLRERLTQVIENEVFEPRADAKTPAKLDLSEITDVESREEADENSL
jgi:hypothetical protein